MSKLVWSKTQRQGQFLRETVPIERELTIRVTAVTLLEHHWLKGARKNAWLADMLLGKLPSHHFAHDS